MRLLLFLLLLPLAAARADTIRTELLTIALNGQPAPLHYLNDSRPATLEAFMTGMGSPVAYHGDRLLRLYRSAADLAPPKGGKPPVPAAEVTLPQAGRCLLLLSLPADENGPIALRAIDVSTDLLRAGDYRIFNFSKHPLAVILGEKRLAVRPGGDATATHAGWRDGILDLPAHFGIANPDGTARTAYSSVWGHRPERRHFLLVFDRDDPNRPLDIRRYHDVPGLAADSP